MHFEYFQLCVRCRDLARAPRVHSYLVGCVMCGGVAKGSGNVDFFQHNHTNPTTTLPCPVPGPVPSHPVARELLGW